MNVDTCVRRPRRGRVSPRKNRPTLPRRGSALDPRAGRPTQAEGVPHLPGWHRNTPEEADDQNRTPSNRLASRVVSNRARRDGAVRLAWVRALLSASYPRLSEEPMAESGEVGARKRFHWPLHRGFVARQPCRRGAFGSDVEGSGWAPGSDLEQAFMAGSQQRPQTVETAE